MFTENLWAKVNPEVVDKPMEERGSEDSDGAGDIGAWRHIVCDLFKKLPSDKQAIWKQRAEEERNLNAAATNEALTARQRLSKRLHSNASPNCDLSEYIGTPKGSLQKSASYSRRRSARQISVCLPWVLSTKTRRIPTWSSSIRVFLRLRHGSSPNMLEKVICTQYQRV